MRQIVNLEILQERVGLLETDSGIVTEAIHNTDLENILEPFLSTVDYQLYFNYGNRIVIGKYVKQTGELNTELLKKSIYYALKGNEYNLKTLIDTINLDYDPINNYEVHETIETSNQGNDTLKYGATSQVTTASISSFGVEIIDELDKMKYTKTVDFDGKENIETFNHGTVTKTTEHDSTANIGSQLNKKVDEIDYAATKETDSKSETLGSVFENRTLDSHKGARTTTSGEEVKVSAYNVNTYQPSSNTSSNSSVNAISDSDTEIKTLNERTNSENITRNKDAHTDTHTVTDTIGPREDTSKGTGSEIIEGYLDTVIYKQNPYNDTDTIVTDPRTNKQTRTEQPHNKSSQTDNKEHEDLREHSDTGKRQRDLKGRYGFTTIQSMIEAERKLANLNIAEKILIIVLHQICEGVLYVW